jgi:hypothetical protein
LYPGVVGAAQHFGQILRKALMGEVGANVDQFRRMRCYHRGVRISDNRTAPQLPLWSEQPAQPVAQVRHSQRARRVAVRITSAGVVELVVPRGVSERRARLFLESRSEWVRHHVERRLAMAPPVEAFPPGRINLQLLGETWPVFQAGGLGALRLREIGTVLELRGTGTREQQRRSLLRWFVARNCRCEPSLRHWRCSTDSNSARCACAASVRAGAAAPRAESFHSIWRCCSSRRM